MKKANEIRNVLIVGGGLMGKNIAFVMTANPTFQVTVYDVRPTNIREGIQNSTRQLLEKGVLSAEEWKERMARIRFTDDIEDPAFPEADLVIEAVFEDLAVKQDTFAKLEDRCRRDACFCTNSSVMSPSQISADGVAETVMEVLSGVGKKPCLCKKDVPGFIANRLQHALWREAISIVEHGIADAQTVDIAIKNSFGLRLPQLGVLENSDMVGTQLTWNIHSYVLPYLEDSHAPSPLLQQMLQEEKMGFSSGCGFYCWEGNSADKCSAELNDYLIRMLYGR